MKKPACLLVPMLPLLLAAQTPASCVSYADAAPIIRALRADPGGRGDRFDWYRQGATR